MNAIHTEHVPIVVAFDRNYLCPAATAIYSLLRCLQRTRESLASPSRTYTIHIYHLEITLKDQEKFNLMLEPYKHFVTLDFIDASTFLETIHNPFPADFLTRFSCLVLIKYFLADLFPQYDKIIWSDVDVLFLDDPTLDFLALDTTQNSYLHAVFLNESEHCLEGFWFCNLAYQRAQNFSQKILDFIYKHKNVKTEPELISFVWPNQISQLPLKYCVFPGFYEHRMLMCIHPNDLPSLQETLDHPVILHYCDFHGVPKPWDYPFSLKTGLWLETLAQTPFAQDFFVKWDNKQEDFIAQISHQVFFSTKNTTLTLIFIIPFRFLNAYLKIVKQRLLSKGWKALAVRVKVKLLKILGAH
ncbi:glycosyltransferase [Helicobacter felis]|uniref:glycosyltransferase n=1 Tax=Helicobacter felis TaxID=214 RepID=UPI000EF6F550|nr:glycosyltransferase [Helicobacter felis]